MHHTPAIPPLASPQELSFLWLEITAKCNLECLHCYADSGPHQQLLGTMTTADWFTVLRDSWNLGCRQVQFIGGEPTLHPDLQRMIAFAAMLGYSFIEVYTNATRISDQLLQTFKDHGVQVAISFYSDDPVTHDQITRRPGSFGRTVHNLRRMLSAGLHVRAGIIAMDENAGHGDRAERFLRELGVRDIEFDYKRGVGRGISSRTSADPVDELCGNCWSGKLCVTSAARVYPCVFARFADLGSAREGIGQILKTNGLRNFRMLLSDRWQERNISVGCRPQTCNPQSFPAPAPCGPNKRVKRESEPDCFQDSAGTLSDPWREPSVTPPCTPPCTPQTCNPQSFPTPLHCRPDQQVKRESELDRFQNRAGTTLVPPAG